MKLHELIDEKYLIPIKKYEKNLENWKNLPIRECNEELVLLNNIDEKVLVIPQYYINNISGSTNECKVRKTVAQKIVEIAHKLPDGYCILVWDAFRTLETQQALFNNYCENFKKETGLDGEKLIEYTCKFVSFPSFDRSKPAPHNTGAAIDLTICRVSGEVIPIGVEFDEFSEKAYTNYYEKKLEKEENLNEEEMEYLLNRRIICNLFAEAEFINDPYEIWHKSFGDQMWCELLNKDFAIYASLELK